MPDAKELLLGILSRYADSDKWVGKPFETVKRLPNTKVGEVGQCLVEQMCRVAGLGCEVPLNARGERARNASWDVRIGGKTFELKTATEDVRGAFQFNHIRFHRAYQALLCIGIGPSDIFMGAWSKADVVTEQAGHLVSMDKGSSATFKLTKRRAGLGDIGQFDARVSQLPETLGNDRLERVT